MHKFKISSILFLICILLSCDKYNLERSNPRDIYGKDYNPELPTLSTAIAKAVTINSAILGGEVVTDGLADVTSRGICWDTLKNPSIALATKKILGKGTGVFESSVTDLKAGTKYYFSPFATNSVGTGYGKQDSLTTLNIPIISTAAISSIEQTTAVCGGNITSDGGANVTARGVCWSTSANPAITLTTKTNDGSGTGTFTSNITGLTAGTTYHVRAFATNAVGTAYGSDITFIAATTISAPAITTSGISGIAITTAIGGGTVTSDGGAVVTARGVCWSSATNPSLTDPKTTDGAGTGLFVSNITGLTAGTTYHLRAYATNSVGTSYGFDIIFTTNTVPVIPSVTTAEITAVTQTSASGGGNVTSDGGAAVTERGVCWSTLANPTITDSKTTDTPGVGLFTSNMTGLTAGTTYHVRAYATNSMGTSYGSDITYTTNTVPVIPSVTTTSISAITQTTASSGGNVTSDGGASITERGICYNTSSNPTIAHSKIVATGTTGTFTSNLTGLTAGTAYYVKAYAINSVGTAYGNEVLFTTTSSGGGIIFNPGLTYGSVSDIDGNLYKTIAIGSQVWMAENLKTTKYNDGSTIPNVTDNSAWAALTTGAYSDYANTPANSSIYGRLYNWYSAASNNPKNVCPTGWHVPTDAEWTILTVYLGGESIAGGKLKETGNTSWTIPNTGADNSTGFSAIPGGRRRQLDSNFDGGAYYGFWWSSTEQTIEAGYSREIAYDNSSFIRIWDYKRSGLSIRCIQDLVQILPVVTTSTTTSITQTTAASGGNVTSDGGASITERGICYNTSSNPTLADSKLIATGTTGTFTSNLTGLTAGTTYYVKAYATNSVGTAYGNQVIFTTSLAAALPGMATLYPINITSNSATLGGQVISDGNATVTERGVVYSTSQDPTTANIKVIIGAGVGAFSTTVFGLTSGITYYVRAYGINSQGTGYGPQSDFTVGQSQTIPSVTTSAATNISDKGAKLGGEVTSSGNALVSDLGIVYATTANPTTANTKISCGGGSGIFSTQISNLTAGTTYHVRAYATNSIGTAYGSDLVITTNSAVTIPTVTVDPAYRISSNTTETSLDVSSDGGLPLIEKGICYSTTSSPTIANTKVAAGDNNIGGYGFTFGVLPGTTYYLRAYATNVQGTAYSNQITFTTPSTSTDPDGNIYNSIIIGTQVWMKENLRTTKYRNGDIIGSTTPTTLDISSQSTPQYQWASGNNESNVAIFGRLYTWYAVTDTRNICPVGWHVPTSSSWTILTDFLGGTAVAGGKLKEIGTTYWLSPNTGASNESGFSGLPGGWRNADGGFGNTSGNGYWWSSKEINITSAESRYAGATYTDLNTENSTSKKTGISVRCIKD
jgi:uncharacterized protein (TIGR02145 family)